MIALALSLGKTEGRQCRFAETIAFVYMQPWGRHWTLREIDGLFSPRQAELDALMESHKNVTDLTAGGEWHEFTYCVDSYLTVFRVHRV